MTREIRIYIADATSFYMNLDGETDIEDVMDCAESQGTVYTLGEFIRQFNNGELTMDLSDNNVVMRACYFDDNEFIGEVE